MHLFRESEVSSSVITSVFFPVNLFLFRQIHYNLPRPFLRTILSQVSRGFP